jgi:hypothetical protein
MDGHGYRNDNRYICIHNSIEIFFLLFIDPIFSLDRLKEKKNLSCVHRFKQMKVNQYETDVCVSN